MIGYGTLALGLVGLVAWLRQEREREYQGPSGEISPLIYRILERARQRLFRGSRDVRFTIFAQDTNKPEVLKPIARLGWGRPSQASGLRFRKGEGMAGIAWEEPRGILLAEFDELQRSDLEVARATRQKVLNLRPETASSLSEEHLLRSRMLVAINLLDCGGWFKGVLCLDFRDPSPASKGWRRFLVSQPVLWTGKDITDERTLSKLSYLATELALALPPETRPQWSPQVLGHEFGARLRRIAPIDAAAA